MFGKPQLDVIITVATCGVCEGRLTNIGQKKTSRKQKRCDGDAFSVVSGWVKQRLHSTHHRTSLFFDLSPSLGVDPVSVLYAIFSHDLSKLCLSNEEVTVQKSKNMKRKYQSNAQFAHSCLFHTRHSRNNTRPTRAETTVLSARLRRNTKCRTGAERNGCTDIFCRQQKTRKGACSAGRGEKGVTNILIFGRV
jgi:hypothetical protein